MKRTTVMLNLLVVLAMVFAVATSASAQGVTGRPLPGSVDALKADQAQTATGVNLKVNPALAGKTGAVNITVRLTEDSIVDLVVAGQAQGKVVTDAQQRAQLYKIKAQQSVFLRDAVKIDAKTKPLGATQRVLNAVMMSFDRAKLAELAANPAVEKINPVVDYQYDMWNVVPYIGAKAVQDMGYDGKGVRAAVLDTGADYTHEDLFGSGNVADYNANDPTIIEPGTFPTAKIIGGTDFVGETWPNGPLTPDPDPLDKVYGAGYPHGTHVSSTMGGKVGVAPGVSIYAVKVCSSVSSSCSGVAMLEGLDFAADPNGDGRVKDRVDLVNMSIGSPYGQAYEDDTSLAVNQLSLLGTLVVASAGNSGNIPYITGTPGAALGALSTAATYNPTEEAQYMNIVSPYTASYGAIFQPWSATLTSPVQADVAYGVGSNKLGCSAFPAGSLAGKIALVDRGTCAISIKVSNMAAAGALVGVVGLVAPGDPTSFAFGGGTPSIPGYNISQADASAIKAALASGPVVASFDPTGTKPLAGVVTGYSSRGPSYWLSYVKPDITAPGNSYSAVAGTGNQFDFAGGTSFSSPTVAGVAAQMMQKFPTLRGHQIKALLVGSAETNTYNFDGSLAPISRIGGGEVRSDKAANASGYAYARKVITGLGTDITSYQPSLSFLFNDVTANWTDTKNVVVTNVAGEDVEYTVTPTFRYADDEANGAVQVLVNGAPTATVTIPGTGFVRQGNFRVDMNIDAQKLREWGFNTGSLGAFGGVFSTFEYDGYLVLDGVGKTSGKTYQLTIPWHVVPRLADNISASASTFTIDPATKTATVDLTNNGAGQGYVDSYSLLAESPKDYPPPAMGSNEYFVDLRYFGVATYETPAGYCGPNEGFVWSFAVNLWDRVTHANVPAAIEVYLDTNNDGTDDYVVLNWDRAYPGISDGRDMTWVFNLATGRGSAYFYTNHGSNSANMVLTVCGDQIGLPDRTQFQTLMGVSVYAWDNYFTGNYTDAITGLQAAPNGDHFFAAVNDVAPGTTETMTIHEWTGVNPDLGVLLFLDGDRGAVRAGAPADNEVLAIKAQP